jgi:hypothetical protein
VRILVQRRISTRWLDARNRRAQGGKSCRFASLNETDCARAQQQSHSASGGVLRWQPWHSHVLPLSIRLDRWPESRTGSRCRICVLASTTGGMDQGYAPRWPTPAPGRIPTTWYGDLGRWGGGVALDLIISADPQAITRSAVERHGSGSRLPQATDDQLDRPVATPCFHGLVDMRYEPYCAAWPRYSCPKADALSFSMRHRHQPRRRWIAFAQSLRQKKIPTEQQ